MMRRLSVYGMYPGCISYPRILYRILKPAYAKRVQVYIYSTVSLQMGWLDWGLVWLGLFGIVLS